MKVRTKFHRISLYGRGCMHEIVQEILTNQGERIICAPDEGIGRIIFADVWTPVVHMPWEKDMDCEKAENEMLAEHLKRMAKYGEEFLTNPWYKKMAVAA